MMAAVSQSSELPDLVAGLLLITMGVCFLALRTRIAAARERRVQAGDMSAADARRRTRRHVWLSIGVIVGGLIVVGRWIVERR